MLSVFTVVAASPSRAPLGPSIVTGLTGRLTCEGVGDSHRNRPPLAAPAAARPAVNRDQIVSVVRGLALPAGDWAVHASAVMVLHGLLEEAGDVDVVARGAAWARALEVGTPVRGRQDLCVALPARGVEIWSGWLDDDVDALIAGAEPVLGLPCVSLEAVLRFKLTSNRPKDQPHIAALRRHLAADERDHDSSAS